MQPTTRLLVAASVLALAASAAADPVTVKTPVHLAVSSCGRFLVIGPTNVKPYIAP